MCDTRIFYYSMMLLISDFYLIHWNFQA